MSQAGKCTNQTAKAALIWQDSADDEEWSAWADNATAKSAALSEEEENTWLSESTQEKDLLKIIRPYEYSDMESYKVSTDVNNIRNQDDTLINPL